jgi:methylated-DNA-[protein]-cysteine S-methyltransferase
MVEPYGWAEIPSPIGPLGIAVTATGLVRVSFGGAAGMADDLARRFPGAVSDLSEELVAVQRELEEYFAGRRRRFELPLDWRFSAGPQRAVLRALYDGVPFGEVVTYAELGARTELGATMPQHEVPRAVGGIMGSNPIPIVVPCHRVVASGGGLGGFGGGLETKRRLLALEGVLPLTFDDVLALGT